VDAERQVGLVKTHAKRRGGNQRFDRVVAQPILQLDTIRGLS
jgi:hypothetical protein